MTIDLPSLFPLTQFPYLAVRIKAEPGSMYFIRPNGLNAQNQPALLWFEDAITDDRPGTGTWETLTFNLVKLVEQARTGADRISEVNLVMVSTDGQPHTLEVDWLRIHRGLTPDTAATSETNFTNHLDEDGDGFTDGDDPDRFTVGRKALFGFERPVTLAFYHVWYGSETGPSKNWLAWAGATPNGFRNPNNFVPNSPGQRDLWSRFYPLNTRAHPSYVPGNPLRYDLHGGVEQYDLLDPDFVDHQIRLAQDSGIDGFLTNFGHQSSLRIPSEAVLRAVERAPQPFSFAPLYDFFYTIGNDFPEQPNFAKAREIKYFSDLAKSPRWMQFLGKPLVTAPFASTLVTANNWTETVALATDPRASTLHGMIDAGSVRKGAVNSVRFRFATGGSPSMRFERIVFRDANLREIRRFVFGTAEARASLDNGWANDTGAPIHPGTFTSGTEATMRLLVPANAEYLDIHASSVTTALNRVSISFNDGPDVAYDAYQLGNVGYFRFSAPAVPQANPADRPFSFLLDNREAAARMDGFATYSEFLTPRNGALVSAGGAVILSVRPGYDDRKIRTPGLFTDR